MKHVIKPKKQKITISHDNNYKQNSHEFIPDTLGQIIHSTVYRNSSRHNCFSFHIVQVMLTERFELILQIQTNNKYNNQSQGLDGCIDFCHKDSYTNNKNFSIHDDELSIKFRRFVPIVNKPENNSICICF